jgi:shikimate kinase
MLIFLIGMPGSGKSSIGKQLAALMDHELIDLDTYIVQKERLSIPQIFKTKGEDHFRKAETSALNEIIEKHKKAIVAVGGGTPCFNNNMHIMQSGGKCIYLKVSIDELAKRIENDTQERPLFHKLNGRKLKEKITSMLAHREKFYKKALMSFEAEGKAPEVLAKELRGMLV